MPSGRGFSGLVRRVGRALRAAGGQVALAGLVFAPVVPTEFLLGRMRRGPVTGDVPGPTSPERLVPDVEPTPEERQLWDQLRDLHA